MNSPVTLVFLGDIAAGKSTQAKRIANQYNLKLIATGEYSRKLVEQQVEGAINRVERGKLTKSQLIQDFLKAEIGKLTPAEGVLIDGGKMPEEATIIHQLLTSQGRQILVLYLTLPTEESKKRFLGRNRTDDIPEALKNRLDYYDKIYSRTVRFWKEQGLLKEIDGNQPVDTVTKAVAREIESYYGLD